MEYADAVAGMTNIEETVFYHVYGCIDLLFKSSRLRFTLRLLSNRPSSGKRICVFALMYVFITPSAI